ncbi:uncharacterized protein LOC142347833 [Convolutriloba macropyga]|uniref:uncharacterized protein LOC142347833 n=1 Tax=Convolutriloba macropyga TaxID=536237 RepID=UPI003F520EB8
MSSHYTTSTSPRPVINLEVPNLKIGRQFPENATCVTYGLTGQKVTSRKKKLVERKVSWREQKGKISSAPSPGGSISDRSMANSTSTTSGPLRRYNLKQQHSTSTTPRNLATSTLNKHSPPSPVPEIDIPKPTQQISDPNLKPIFVPISWSMPYKPPLADPGVISLYPRDILHFRQGPEKTLTEIRASQSVLVGSLKKSILSTAQPPPVTPASRQITNIS